MWPFKKRPSQQPAPTNASEFKAPIKEVVASLMRLHGAQWHEEREEGHPASSQLAKERYATTSNSGTPILVTHEETSDLTQGELLRNSYELFINGDLIGTYFECSYTSGGKLDGGEPCVADLYKQVAHEVAENRTNSREWRASQHQATKR